MPGGTVVIDRLAQPQMPRQEPAARPLKEQPSSTFSEVLSSAPDAMAREEAEATQTAQEPSPEWVPTHLAITPSRESDLAIELHVRGAHGQAEIICSPWRLVPGGYLAQSLDLGQSLEPFPPEGTGVAESSSAITDGVDGGVPALAARGMWEASRAAAPAGVAHVPSKATEPGSRTEASTKSHAAVWSMAPWAERLIRWLEQQGHAPTVWIRDYRLDDSASARLAEALREHARGDGIEIERIIVNAREIWRSPSATSSEGNS